MDIRPDNTHFEGEGYQRWRESASDIIRARGRRYVDELVTSVGAPASAVEIGCATGETIGRLAELGVRCWAVDSSSAAIARAQVNYPDVNFATDLLPHPDQSVDVVLMMHVIEHVPDPVETLRSVRTLLTQNGILYLRFPNYGGLAAMVLRGTWPDYMAEHLHYFTRRSMREALAKSGWEATHVWTTASSWAWLGGCKRIVKHSRPKLSAARHGAPPSQRQMKILAASDRLGWPFLRMEERIGRGNELVILARPAAQRSAYEFQCWEPLREPSGRLG